MDAGSGVTESGCEIWIDLVRGVGVCLGGACGSRTSNLLYKPLQALDWVCLNLLPNSQSGPGQKVGTLQYFDSLISREWRKAFGHQPKNLRIDSRNIQTC